MGRPPAQRDASGHKLTVPAFGPAIPIVPIKDFTKGFTRQQLEDVWQVVGPSVMRNMEKGLPLWQIMAAAYSEGLLHGTELAVEKATSRKLDRELNREHEHEWRNRI